MRLGLTQAGIQVVGGPSRAWLTALPHLTSEPSTKHAAALAKLDAALQWPDGTSWSVVTKDRSHWPDELLEDEERELVEETHDESDNFAFVVAARLRAMPEAERRAAMHQILEVLGLAPGLGDT
jgi:hypothetical protein